MKSKRTLLMAFVVGLSMMGGAFAVEKSAPATDAAKPAVLVVSAESASAVDQEVPYKCFASTIANSIAAAINHQGENAGMATANNHAVTTAL